MRHFIGHCLRAAASIIDPLNGKFSTHPRRGIPRGYYTHEEMADGWNRAQLRYVNFEKRHSIMKSMLYRTQLALIDERNGVSHERNS